MVSEEARDRRRAQAKRANTSAYKRRIDRVIDYLREHLDRPVKLTDLAKVACFSPFHFHRVFHAVTGETVKSFTNRLRVERAARLLRSSSKSATDVALDCGFSSSATFSRAFRAAYETTPREFRKSGKIQESKIRKDLLAENEYFLPMTEAEKRAAFPVTLVDLPARTIAYLRVTNPEERRIIGAFAKMRDWAKTAGILDDGTLFGMSMDDPSVTPKHLYRYEVCFASERPFACEEGMTKAKMPARRYAVVKVSGDLRLVATAWDYLFSHWLIQSAYEPDQAPALEIFMNKAKATDWSHFDLQLCLPVKRLTND